MAQAKKARLPAKVAARAKAAVQGSKPPPRPEALAKKAKVVAALKRLHPMD